MAKTKGEKVSPGCKRGQKWTCSNHNGADFPKESSQCDEALLNGIAKLDVKTAEQVRVALAKAKG